ncbi:acyl carrier protein [Iningainema tapete]|uniref:Acyl carrier protein n=1 Tax=Iningainema tapete BLCC-T55 TaxID=2748662 RepID=A0A8J6XK85_9CYAN|nr:acyl carrier protein [Iningainema tapete]MBD2774462.1 acyl carrier protein [Iningainema tapete BLCC-T55]
MLQLQEQEIFHLIQEATGHNTSDLQEDTALFSSGIMDSLAMLDLISLVEKKLKIRIPPQDIHLGNLDSVNKIQKYLSSRT